MKRLLTALILLAAGLLVAQSRPAKKAEPAAAPAEKTRPGRVIELIIADVIHPVMADYITNGFKRAREEQADLILISVNTPGGLDTSMREIIRLILESPIPVAVYVWPSGSRAASAGFYILESADIAVMAPGTSTGAASPLLAIGGVPVDANDTLRKKVLNDASAYLRSITSKRGRNVEVAEKAVTEAYAFSEKEALEQNLIDLVAGSPEELLEKLDGRQITRFDGSSATLALARPVRVPVEMTGRERFLTRILRPDVFFVLLIVGVLGLYAEFTHPGLFVPGVVGAISLVLALFAMFMLPVNVVGILLIVVALALFILEAKFPSHGILGVGGAIAMILGALMLIPSGLTGFGVSLSMALAVTVPFALITVFLMRLVIRSMAWKPGAGVEMMLGMTGEVTQAIDGRGMVFVNGELWRAASATPIPQGASVRVVKVDGLLVHVEPVDAPGVANSPQN